FEFAHDRLRALRTFARVEQVGLVEHEPARTVEQFGIEFLEFRLDRAHLVDRIDVLGHRRHVDQMQQQARARDVLEELDAEPRTFRRTFDQSGNVGDHEALIGADAHHAQMRLQRGERIVRNPRRGGGHRAYKSGFSRIRKTEHADIGQHLELQAQLAHLAWRARHGLARRAIRRTLEYRVAGAALAAHGNFQALAMLRQVADHFLGIDVDHGRTDRYPDDLVFAALAGHLAAHAVLATLGAEAALMTKVDQRVEAFVGYQPHVATIAAMATVGPAERNEFLAPETDAAVAAVAGVYGDFSFVDEFHDGENRKWRMANRKSSLRRDSSVSEESKNSGPLDSRFP